MVFPYIYLQDSLNESPKLIFTCNRDLAGSEKGNSMSEEMVAALNHVKGVLGYICVVVVI